MTWERLGWADKTFGVSLLFIQLPSWTTTAESLYTIVFLLPALLLPTNSSKDLATKLKSFGFTPVWYVKLFFHVLPWPLSLIFALHIYFPVCICFRQPALYNMALQFFMTIDSENYGRIMTHLDTQVSVTKGIILMICLLCTIFVLFVEALTNYIFINANCCLLEGKINGIK